MKKEFTKQVLAAVILCISVSLSAQESVDLKYGFTPGKNFIQSAQLTQNTVQSMGGQEMKVLADIISKNLYTVESVDKDGNATVVVSVTDLSVRTSMMGRDTTMKYNDLKDKSKIVLSNSGKTLSTSKLDSSQSASIFDQMNSGRLRSVPGKVVKVGETWSEKDTITRNPSGGTPLSVNIESETENTLVGKESRDGKEYYKVSYTISMTINGKGTQMGMELYMEGTGKSQGFYLFDPKLAMIGYSEEDAELNMNVAVSGPQNMTIPMTQSMKTITTFEVVK